MILTEYEVCGVKSVGGVWTKGMGPVMFFVRLVMIHKHEFHSCM